VRVSGGCASIGLTTRPPCALAWLMKPASQELLGAVQPALYAILCDPERARHFGGAHFIHRSHSKHSAIPGRYLIERPPQLLAQLGPKGLSLRICGNRYECRSAWIVVIILQTPMPSHTAYARHCLVEHDSGEPGKEAGPPAELVETRERPKVGCLHNIFDFHVVPEHSPQNWKETRLIAMHQDVIERSVARPDMLDYTIVGYQIFGWREHGLRLIFSRRTAGNIHDSSVRNAVSKSDKKWRCLCQETVKGCEKRSHSWTAGFKARLLFVESELRRAEF
jgi:hypothetical protein